MKTFYKFLPALLAIVVFAAPALAQEGARRNNSVSARQEDKAEKKQMKVDKAQAPTNVSNQGATDIKLHATPDSQGSRRGGTENGGGSNSGNVGMNGNVNSGNNGGGNKPSGNGGYTGNTGNKPSGNGGYNGNTGYNSGNRPPANNGGMNNGAGKPPVNNGNGGNRPPVNNGGMNNGHNANGAYIPGYNNAYPGRRPNMPTVRNYTRTEIYERTNAAGIVVNTMFSSKMEAYYYIANLLDERYYTLSSYGNNYNWIRSEVSFIPTPFEWTNPMTHNQFQMYFKITSSFGRIKVTITAQWRESVLSNKFSVLRYQPSNAYSTYYAWNVLEDIAENIPNTGIYFKTSDLL